MGNRIKKFRKPKDFDRPPYETKAERKARKERERDMWEARAEDPFYDHRSGQVRPRIEQE